LPLATNLFLQILPLANVQIFDFLIGLPVWAVNVCKEGMEEKNEKIFRFTGCLGIIYVVIWIM